MNFRNEFGRLRRAFLARERERAFRSLLQTFRTAPGAVGRVCRASHLVQRIAACA